MVAQYVDIDMRYVFYEGLHIAIRKDFGAGRIFRTPPAASTLVG